MNTPPLSSPLRDTLTGSLIGLARSTTNEPKTEDTDRILLQALSALSDPMIDDSRLVFLNDKVNAEKHRVAPNCATCRMRCGNTDNYDMKRFRNAPSEQREIKQALLSSLSALGSTLYPLVLSGSVPAAPLNSVYKGLFALAEDWSVPYFQATLSEVQSACLRYSTPIAKQ